MEDNKVILYKKDNSAIIDKEDNKAILDKEDYSDILDKDDNSAILLNKKYLCEEMLSNIIIIQSHQPHTQVNTILPGIVPG